MMGLFMTLASIPGEPQKIGARLRRMAERERLLAIGKNWQTEGELVADIERSLGLAPGWLDLNRPDRRN
jgi:hypothetical protein